MRILLSALLLFILISSCNKKNNYSVCEMRQVQQFANGTLNSTINYEYDVQGRLKKILSSTNTDTYDYFPDSVVITTTSPNGIFYTRTTYLLNSAGLATSAKVRGTPTPEDIKTDYVYTYDAAGYLITERMIFSQVYNGNVLNDTTYTNYTVVNGNITKRTETNSVDFGYEYSADAMPDNVPFLNQFPSRVGSFLGKHTNNLVARIITSGNPQDNFSYSFDRGKKVSELTITNAGSPGGTTKFVFHYACD